MRFTIGKKIGAGFLFLLLLSTIVSGIMYSAIQLGIDVSSKISTERFPRYNINTSLQKQLLTAGYKIRIFFDTSNEEALKEYKASIQQCNETLEKLKVFNKNFPCRLELKLTSPKEFQLAQAWEVDHQMPHQRF